MKSILTTTVICAIAGAALGAAIGYFEARPPVPVVETPADTPQEKETDKPKAVVAETTYEFGTMEQNTSLSHAFVVRNEGDAPLKIALTSTTCKCTVSNLAEGEVEEIPPGGELDVDLEWTAKTGPGPFRHGARLRTNDPRASSISLTVEGTVVESSALEPNDFRFGTIRTGETKTVSVYLLSFVEDTIDVTLHEPTMEEIVDVKATPLDPSELEVENLRAAVRIDATFKSGESLGPFFDTLEVETSLEKAKKLSIPMIGRVVGNVSLFGPKWNDDRAMLVLGSIKSSEGATAKLHLNARGEGADAAEFTVREVDPPELQVTLGKAQRIAEGLVTVPLKVEVPPGTPVMARSGGPSSELGEIVLGSNLPGTSQVRLRVRFTVHE